MLQREKNIEWEVGLTFINDFLYILSYGADALS